MSRLLYYLSSVLSGTRKTTSLNRGYESKLSGRGSVLILLLWILSFLFLIGLEISFVVEKERRLYEYQRDSLLRKAACYSAVEQSRMLLQKDDPNLDSTQDQWYKVKERLELGPGLYAEMIRKDFSDSATPHYGMEDMESKIPLRSLSREQVIRVLQLKEEQLLLLPPMEKFVLFEDLSQIFQILSLDAFQMMGEDQNDDGILNRNENDADLSLPVDNADGALDGGISDFCTWASLKINVNTVTKEALERLLPGKNTKIQTFLQKRKELGLFKSLPMEELEMLGIEPSLCSVNSSFFLLRVRGVYQKDQFQERFLLKRDSSGVRVLRKLIF